ncbi:MAG TPA: 3-methyl-2-oxobutanoate dehydrogenase subunit VorB [Candidatus Limnocylindrales bacterium]|nr:3-methyl-2-oxobutanoate dehydrogenase subunit VorB [Candidatus Limnocylindrales bacterium]
MKELVLMKGNEAVAEAAIRAGCRYYFGYPITPQNEILEYMSWRLPEVGGVFIQAESEIAAINMVYGAAAAGVRAMTSSSSPGISLKLEGISYLCGSELPATIVNMTRGGPGLGTIQPAQSDYFQAVKGGGHGDYRLLVYGPESVQEMVDLTFLGVERADHYRNPVLILGDGILGQIMEPVCFPPFVELASLPNKPWAATGRHGGPKRVVNSLYLEPEDCEEHNRHLQAKYQDMANIEKRWETIQAEDASLLVVAFGTTARICRTSVENLREKGFPVGLFRPVSLWPFPDTALDKLLGTGRVRAVLVVEMNAGQMVEDVRLVACGRVPVHFYGRMGGMVPTPEEIQKQVTNLL